jgi:short-subunit dehydrogenase
MSLFANTLVILFLLIVGLSILGVVIRAWRLYSRRRYFEGKVVVLTGASRGIGRSLALALAARGAHLVLAARRADQLDEVDGECRQANPTIQVLTVPTDVTNETQLTRLIHTAVNRFGQIDILLCNAGIIQGGAIADVDLSSIRQQVEVNLMSSIRLVQLALPAMLGRGEGTIVLMASAAGRHTAPYLTGYSISKHGLVGFGDGLRRELVGTGIREMTVNPGFTATDMVTSAEPAYQRMGFRMISPERVALRTLQGMMLGVPEVNIGLMETIGQWASALAPALADLYWRLLMPPEFPTLVSKQKTE